MGDSPALARGPLKAMKLTPAMFFKRGAFPLPRRQVLQKNPPGAGIFLRQHGTQLGRLIGFVPFLREGGLERLKRQQTRLHHLGRVAAGAVHQVVGGAQDPLGGSNSRSAVIDDGQQSIVFVQTDAARQQYTMRRVQLTRRFEKTVFVRSKLFGKGEDRTHEEAELGMFPKEPLLPGEHVLQTGVGELKAVLLDKESRPKKKVSEGR